MGLLLIKSPIYLDLSNDFQPIKQQSIIVTNDYFCFQSDLVAINTQPSQIAKEADRIQRQKK